MAEIPVEYLVPAAFVVGLSIGGGIAYANWQAAARLRSAARRIAERHQQQASGNSVGRDMASLASSIEQADRSVRAQLADQRATDLRPLVDALPDPLLLTDSRGRLQMLNQAAARLLQLRPNQGIGLPLATVITDQPVLELLDGMAASTAVADKSGDDAPRPVVFRDVRVYRGGQNITYQAVATRNADGATLVVMRDVSQLTQAAQMKTDFVANASHELRTPIAAIKMAFETLREVYTDDPDQTQRCIAVIDGHIHRLEEMLQDLLDLSRVEDHSLDPNLQPVRLDELYAVMRATLGPIAKLKPVELVFTSDSDRNEYPSDQRLLSLILKNLIENAIKFTPAGGRVTVTTTDHLDGGFTLTVTDTGIGIPPEHIDRVFERFYQVEQARTSVAGRGTGLGLAIVKHAVHAMGGTVNLTSEVGRGTSIVCRFPVTKSAGMRSH
jgi:two-component system phosphate regulon sensor histidine kinase PhoR